MKVYAIFAVKLSFIIPNAERLNIEINIKIYFS